MTHQNHLWGYENHPLTGTVQAGSEVQGLPASNLQNDQGDTASAWQTGQGVVTSAAGAWFVVDAGADVTWRATLLARTNLTSAAQIRVRVGSRSSVVEEPALYDIDLRAGLPAGATFTRASTATYYDYAGVIRTAGSGVPRIGYRYDAATGTWIAAGYLSEEQRTNSVRQSAALSASPWTATASVTSSSVAAPDGSLTAVLADATAADQVVQQVVTISNDTATRTFSLFLRQGTALRSALYLEHFGGTSYGALATINWSALTITNNFNCLAVALTPVGGGWYRAAVSVANNGAGNTNLTCRLLPAGSASYGGGTGSVHAWGAQVEGGAGATSYIPTTSAAATRQADAAWASVSGLAGVLTVFADVVPLVRNTSLAAALRLDDGSNDNSVAVVTWAGSASLYAAGAVGGIGQFDFGAARGPDTVGVPQRLAVALALNDIAQSVNGGTAATDTSALVPPITALRIGSSLGGAVPLNGFVTRVALYGKRLTNAQIQGLTGAAGSTLTAPTYDSGAVTPGVVPGVGQALHVLPSDATGQCLRIDIDDPTNPDRMINVPLAYTGPVWQPQYNFGYGSTQGQEARRADVVTRGGQTYPRLDSVARRQSLELRAVTTDEVWTRLAPLMRAAETGGNILCVPDPEGAYRQHETIFGPLKTEADISYPYQGSSLRGWTATQTERL
ncbi:phage head spike fiber domain-containing protein [Azospirillum himalayense]|uniref:Concanavalin A-like lectin/glucanase superfamily protein n=1 Tax=Azospirillum himalayense TaxID=654847 RepID=A0ABW0GEE8_9PROT